MFRSYLRYWYDISAAVAMLTVMVLVLAGDQFTYVQRLILGNFVFMQLHFFEEFHVPGGFPGVCNIAQYHSEQPAYYPLNQLSAAFGNNWFGCFVYLLPFFFPELTWLVLAPMVFGFIELFMHLFVFNKILETPYNPGLLTSIVGFVPIGAAYILYALQNGLLHGVDWVGAIAYPMLTYLVIFQFVGIKLMGRRDTPYPFAPAEMARFDQYQNEKAETNGRRPENVVEYKQTKHHENAAGKGV